MARIDCDVHQFCPVASLPSIRAGAEIVPIMSVSGMLFTTGMGLLFGYIFQRTGNIVAPWLAHALAGLALMLTGSMTFVQYVE